MPTLTNATVSSGARFITHTHGSDVIVVEALHGHILSISVGGSSDRYYGLFGKGGSQHHKTVGEINPPYESHEAAHALGITRSNDHSHWGSLRGSIYDGYTLLTLLSAVVGNTVAMQISDIVRQQT